MKHQETLMWEEISETPRIFGEIQAINAEEMKRLVNAVGASSATNFVVAARGTSDHALLYFKYITEIYTKYTVSAASPSVLTVYNGKVDYKNSIVIGCSQSGKAADVLEVIKRGNEQGAITVGITNDENSPVAKEAKFHLFCAAGEEKSVAATKTFSAQLFLMFWLSSEIAENEKNLGFAASLKDKIEALIPEIDSLTDTYSEKFKDMKSGFILSRGITYAIALEATLKLQETCYIQMKGFASSDFYHGPMAMVNEDTPVIIYCANDRDADENVQTLIRNDHIKCIDKMISLGAPVLIVTNDEKLAGRYPETNCALLDFPVPEEICMFAFALFAQMFACKVSCAIGNNPDSPRALKKVTITK